MHTLHTLQWISWLLLLWYQRWYQHYVQIIIDKNWKYLPTVRSLLLVQYLLYVAESFLFTVLKYGYAVKSQYLKNNSEESGYTGRPSVCLLISQSHAHHHSYALLTQKLTLHWRDTICNLLHRYNSISKLELVLGL